MPYCPKCGKEVPADSQFCSSCGADLSGANAPPVMESPPKSAPSDVVAPSSTGKKSHTKAIIAVVVIVAIVAVVLIAGVGGIQQTLQGALSPNVQVTSQSMRTGFTGVDYTVYVDANVYNSGGKGTVTIWASVTQGGNTWTDSQSVYLDAKGSTSLEFTFIQPTLLGGTVSYSVWVG